MAKRVIESLVDDLDGSSTADETVEFSVDGVQYAIDLSADNAAKLRDALAPYVQAGRRTGGRRASAGREGGREGGRGGRSSDAPSPTAVREWAKGAGVEVNERGRIAKSVIEQYRAAQG